MLACFQLTHRMTFDKYLSAVTARVSAGGVGPATSPALQAALAASDAAEKAAETPQTEPGALVENPGPSPLPDTLSTIEEAFSINSAQARIMRDELINIAFSGNERTADRLKAMEMLREMVALNKRDRIRDQSRPGNQTNIFNVQQTVKGATDISRTIYEADDNGN